MSEAFIGQIQPFAFPFAPQNWTNCNGQMLGINQNTALFSLISTTYGGNGSTNFGIPDLRGRAMLNQGQLSGGQSYNIGQVGGTENATLVTNNLPSHNHSLNALNGNGTVNAAQNNVLATANYTDSDGNAFPVTVYAPAGSGLVPMAPQSIGSIGNSTPFSILQPFQVINVCICLYGIFPTRS